VPRTPRTTKKLAQRIDMNYFQRPHPLRRWRFWLSVTLPALAVLWLVWHAATRNNKVYSSGRMSAAHAVLTNQCAACHVSQAGFFRSEATDQRCLACHDGAIHHANQVFTPGCSSCHVEHLGPRRLAATRDASCTQCHANLATHGAATQFVRMIDGFNEHHPEFAAVRPGNADPGTIKFNHSVHMKPNLRGPAGLAQLDCNDCHRTPAASQPWPYGLAQFRTVSTAPKADPLAAPPTRAYMASVSYAKHCAACHPLPFDKRFTESVPHDTPEVVHAFVLSKFQSYIAAHPAELREVTEPDRNLPGKPILPSVRVFTPPQWVLEQVADAEQLLWNKTCKECHTLNFSPGAPLPTVAKSNITVRWMPHAVFDHNQHRMLTCASCHAALTSEETADVLLPGIRLCQQCHHPGTDAAESRCFECHTYHDRAKEKETKGKFTLPELLHGARPRSSALQREATGAQP
jgi:hypothetical protein